MCRLLPRISIADRRLDLRRGACAFVLALLWAAVAGAAAVTSDSAADPCPLSAVRLRGGTYAYYDAPRLDTTLTTLAGDFKVSYDLVAGTMAVSRPVANVGVVQVVPSDRYDLAGLPAGTTASIAVELHVIGHVESANTCGGSGCGAQLDASILMGSTEVDTVISVGFVGSADLDGALRLPLTVTAGEPFELQFDLLVAVGPGGDGYGGWGAAWIHFADLPPGSSIASCQGYAEQAVPTQDVSWGRLKQTYR